MKYWYNPIKDKTLEKRKRKFESRINRGRYETKEQETYARNSLYRTQLTKKATKEEIIFGDWLWNNKIPFKFQKGFIVPFHRIADFYIPAGKIIIEIDGGYHKDVWKKDNSKDRLWKLRGYKTLRILNEQVNNGSFTEIYKHFQENNKRCG